MGSSLFPEWASIRGGTIAGDDWSLASGIAQGLDRLDSAHREEIMASWGESSSQSSEAFAHRIFTTGALAALVRSRPGWRSILAQLAFAPPRGVARFELAGDAELLRQRGLLFESEDERYLVPWELVCVAAPYLQELPPLLVARLGAKDRSELEAIARAIGLPGGGSPPELILGVRGALYSVDALTRIIDALPADTAGALLRFVDLGGRPIDPGHIGEPALADHFERLVSVGVAHLERGAYFIPIDVNERLAAWRQGCLNAQLERARERWLAASRSDPEPPVIGDAARLLRGVALADLWQSRHGQAALFDPGCTTIWRAMTGDAPQSAFARLGEIGRGLGQRSQDGVPVLDLDESQVLSHALVLVIRGLGSCQGALSALFAVEEYAVQLITLRGAQQKVASQSAEHADSFSQALAVIMRQLGTDMQSIDELTDAVGKLLGEWFTDYYRSILEALYGLPPDTSYPGAMLSELLSRVAHLVAARRCMELLRFGTHFLGRAPIASCASLLGSDHARASAAHLADLLIDHVFHPLGLLMRRDDGRLYVSRRLTEAIGGLYDPAEAAPRNSALSLSVDGEQLVASWPAGQGSFHDLRVFVGAGTPELRDSRLMIRVDGMSLQESPVAPLFWSQASSWPITDAAVDRWMARYRPALAHPGAPGVTADKEE